MTMHLVPPLTPRLGENGPKWGIFYSQKKFPAKKVKKSCKKPTKKTHKNAKKTRKFCQNWPKKTHKKNVSENLKTYNSKKYKKCRFICGPSQALHTSAGRGKCILAKKVLWKAVNALSTAILDTKNFRQISALKKYSLVVLVILFFWKKWSSQPCKPGLTIFMRWTHL